MPIGFPKCSLRFHDLRQVDPFWGALRPNPGRRACGAVVTGRRPVPGPRRARQATGLWDASVGAAGPRRVRGVTTSALREPRPPNPLRSLRGSVSPGRSTGTKVTVSSRVSGPHDNSEHSSGARKLGGDGGHAPGAPGPCGASSHPLGDIALRPPSRAPPLLSRE